jgi:hypothetical protein
MTDRKTLDQAREWAEHAKTLDEMSVWPTARAAAEVIQSLPDEIIDGAKLREILKDHHPSKGGIVNMRLWESLTSLLPKPADPRTLADMDPESTRRVPAMSELDEAHEEWAAIVAFINPAGQTEESRGHGTTEAEALADARDRQQWLTNPTEYAHATYRRLVTAWERFTTMTTEETSSD